MILRQVRDMIDFRNNHRFDSLSDDASIDVDTGELRVSSEPVILRAVAIGSCVAVIVHDRIQKTGGLAHIMLPGRSIATESESRTKYTEDAIDVLFEAFRKLGSENCDLEISIVGGANVLREGNIPKKVTKSVKDYLKKLNLGWQKERIGGTERRSVFLDTATGTVFYSEGDQPAQELLATGMVAKNTGGM